MPRLSNKSAIVTGAGSGIGKATAKLFAAEGAKVFILEKDHESGHRTASEIKSTGAEAHALDVDLGDGANTEAAVAKAAQVLGGVDILVNNAATCISRDFFETSRDEWHRVMDVNLTAYFLCARGAAEEMRRKGVGGSIVNIASVHQRISEPRSGAYAAAKGGVAQLTRNLAIEFAPYGIVVNSISPGFIRTSMSIVDGVDETTTERFMKSYIQPGRIPLRRAGLPEEVAAAALFLAARESTYITGADLVVDGGLTITL